MKTRVFIAFLVVVMGSTIAVQAVAQDTITLMFDDPVNGLQRYGYWERFVRFEIVALIETTHPVAAIEFVMTDPSVNLPGLSKTWVVALNETQLDIRDFPDGEYVVSFDRCVPAGRIEAIRIGYHEWYGYWPWDLALRIRGLQPGDRQVSQFEGHIGYIDCEGNKHRLEPVPWSEYGMADDEDLAGAVVINPFVEPVATDERPVSVLKSRY